MTEKELIEEINNSSGWYLTKEIDNPSPKLQMVGIKRNFNIIRDMTNPCDEVLEYVNNLSDKDKSDLVSWSSNIQFIKEPNEKLQMHALLSGKPHLVIRYINNPAKKVLKYLKKYEKINEDTETQLEAVLKDGLNLRYIAHFEYWQQGDEFTIDKKVELSAIKQNIKAVKYLNTNSMNQETIDYINTDEDMQIKVLKLDEYFISNIKKPSEKVQLTAVKSAYDPLMIVYDFIKREDLCKKLERNYF